MVRKGKEAGITGSICRELLALEIRPKGFVPPFKFYVTLTDDPSPDSLTKCALLECSGQESG